MVRGFSITDLLPNVVPLLLDVISPRPRPAKKSPPRDIIVLGAAVGVLPAGSSAAAVASRYD